MSASSTPQVKPADAKTADAPSPTRPGRLLRPSKVREDAGAAYQLNTTAATTNDEADGSTAFPGDTEPFFNDHDAVQRLAVYRRNRVARDLVVESAAVRVPRLRSTTGGGSRAAGEGDGEETAPRQQATESQRDASTTRRQEHSGAGRSRSADMARQPRASATLTSELRARWALSQDDVDLDFEGRRESPRRTWGLVERASPRYRLIHEDCLLRVAATLGLDIHDEIDASQPDDGAGAFPGQPSDPKRLSRSSSPDGAALGGTQRPSSLDASASGRSVAPASLAELTSVFRDAMEVLAADAAAPGFDSLALGEQCVRVFSEGMHSLASAAAGLTTAVAKSRAASSQSAEAALDSADAGASPSSVSEMTTGVAMSQPLSVVVANVSNAAKRLSNVTAERAAAMTTARGAIDALEAMNKRARSMKTRQRKSQQHVAYSAVNDAEVAGALERAPATVGDLEQRARQQRSPTPTSLPPSARSDRMSPFLAESELTRQQLERDLASNTERVAQRLAQELRLQTEAQAKEIERLRLKNQQLAALARLTPAADGPSSSGDSTASRWELQRLRNAVTKLERSNRTAQGDADSAQRRICDLEATLQSAEDELAEAHAESDRLREALASQTEGAQEDAAAAIVSLEQEIHALESERDSALSEADAARNELDRHLREMSIQRARSSGAVLYRAAYDGAAPPMVHVATVLRFAFDRLSHLVVQNRQPVLEFVSMDDLATTIAGSSELNADEARAAIDAATARKWLVVRQRGASGSPVRRSRPSSPTKHGGANAASHEVVVKAPEIGRFAATACFIAQTDGSTPAHLEFGRRMYSRLRLDESVGSWKNAGAAAVRTRCVVPAGHDVVPEQGQEDDDATRLQQQVCDLERTIASLEADLEHVNLANDELREAASQSAAGAHEDAAAAVASLTEELDAVIADRDRLQEQLDDLNDPGNGPEALSAERNAALAERNELRHTIATLVADHDREMRELEGEVDAAQQLASASATMIAADDSSAERLRAAVDDASHSVDRSGGTTKKPSRSSGDRSDDARTLYVPACDWKAEDLSKCNSLLRVVLGVLSAQSGSGEAASPTDESDAPASVTIEASELDRLLRRAHNLNSGDVQDALAVATSTGWLQVTRGKGAGQRHYVFTLPETDELRFTMAFIAGCDSLPAALRVADAWCARLGWATTARKLRRRAVKEGHVIPMPPEDAPGLIERAVQQLAQVPVLRRAVAELEKSVDEYRRVVDEAEAREAHLKKTVDRLRREGASESPPHAALTASVSADSSRSASPSSSGLSSSDPSEEARVDAILEASHRERRVAHQLLMGDGDVAAASEESDDEGAILADDIERALAVNERELQRSDEQRERRRSELLGDSEALRRAAASAEAGAGVDADNLPSDVPTLQSALLASDQRVRELTEQIDILTTNHESAAEELQTTLDEALAQCDRLAAKLEDDGEHDDTTAALEGLEKERDALVEDNDALAARLDATEADHEQAVQTLQAELDEAVSDRDRLNAELEGAHDGDDAAAVIAAVEAERDELLRERDELAERVQDMEEDHETAIEALQKELDEAVAGRDELNAALEAAQAASDAGAAIAALESERDELLAERDQLQEALSTAQADALAVVRGVEAERDELLEFKDRSEARQATPTASSTPPREAAKPSPQRRIVNSGDPLRPRVVPREFALRSAVRDVLSVLLSRLLQHQIGTSAATTSGKGKAPSASRTSIPLPAGCVSASSVSSTHPDVVAGWPRIERQGVVEALAFLASQSLLEVDDKYDVVVVTPVRRRDPAGMVLAALLCDVPPGTFLTLAGANPSKDLLSAVRTAHQRGIVVIDDGDAAEGDADDQRAAPPRSPSRRDSADADAAPAAAASPPRVLVCSGQHTLLAVPNITMRAARAAQSVLRQLVPSAQPFALTSQAVVEALKEHAVGRHFGTLATIDAAHVCVTVPSVDVPELVAVVVAALSADTAWQGTSPVGTAADTNLPACATPRAVEDTLLVVGVASVEAARSLMRAALDAGVIVRQPFSTEQTLVQSSITSVEGCLSVACRTALSLARCAASMSAPSNGGGSSDRVVQRPIESMQAVRDCLLQSQTSARKLRDLLDQDLFRFDDHRGGPSVLEEQVALVEGLDAAIAALGDSAAHAGVIHARRSGSSPPPS